MIYFLIVMHLVEVALMILILRKPCHMVKLQEFKPRRTEVYPKRPAHMETHNPYDPMR